MAARGTGFALLCSSSVQEAQDLALIATAATLEARVPFLHFFDGFRTSHEVNVIELSATTRSARWFPTSSSRPIATGRSRPDRPVLRGSAQNPDVFFQAREAANPFYAATPGSSRRRWTASRSSPAAATRSSTTPAPPMPSA